MRLSYKLSNFQITEENSPKEYCSWNDIEVMIQQLSDLIIKSGKNYDSLLAINNGGIIPARLLARELEIYDIQFIPFQNKILLLEQMPSLVKNKQYLIIDDIYDTGLTFAKVFNKVKEYNCEFAFLMSRFINPNAKLVAKILNNKNWIVFPWEKKRYRS